MSTRKAYLFGKKGYVDYQVVVTDYSDAEWALSVLTIVTPRATYTLTEGTDFDNETSNTVTAGNIATAIAALSGFSDTKIGTGLEIVWIMPEPWVEITSITIETAAGATMSGLVGAVTSVTSEKTVGLPGTTGGTRLSNPVRVDSAEYFSAYFRGTWSGAGTPDFDIDYRTAADFSGSGVNPATGGIDASVAWGPWSSQTTFTGSDGDVFQLDDELTPAVSSWIQFRVSNNDATNPVSPGNAPSTAGFFGVLHYW